MAIMDESMEDPPKLTNGSVSPFVGNAPEATPILIIKNKEDEDNTDQSGFLRHYSHDEVGMSLGQVVELLDGTAEPYAEEFTTAEGDERM